MLEIEEKVEEVSDSPESDSEGSCMKVALRRNAVDR